MPLPIDFASGFYNSLHYRASRDHTDNGLASHLTVRRHALSAVGEDIADEWRNICAYVQWQRHDSTRTLDNRNCRMSL